MAEFQEVIRQKKRMCQSVSCCKCDIYLMCGQELSKCSHFISNNPKKAEEIIMSWAAEHQEPVYPTWIDWLMSEGVIPDGYSAMHSMKSEVRAATFFVTSKAFMPIPASMAQNLGIKPKEG